MDDTPEGWLNARDAAAHLRVSRQTLYAYVSRGLLHADTPPGARASRYRRAEVERLALQHGAARNPKQAARTTLDWGLPVMNSALTLIHDGRLYYRGQDVQALADHATLEDVAALLWQCEASRIVAAAHVEPDARTLAALAGPRGLPHPRRGLAAFHGLLALQRAPRAGLDDTPQAGARLLSWMRAATTLRTLPAAAAGQPLHRQLQRAWRRPAAVADTIRAALVLCADHELNASSFTTRCVASTGAALDACVAAGLAAVSGARHGGVTATVEALWPRWMALPRARAGAPLALPGLATTPAGALQEIGFGHPLYPDGDPRAQALLARLPRDAARERLIAEMHERTGLQPSIDFALVAVRRHLGLPAGAAFALFAIARTVGWVAHALEQRAAGGLIRPRAAYVGLPPTPRAPGAADAGMTRRVIRRR